jgi:hypothetical protein
MIVKNVGIAIRDLGSVPSGYLYAQLMGILTLDQYNAIIDALKSAKMVSESGHLLTWIGPKE